MPVWLLLRGWSAWLSSRNNPKCKTTLFAPKKFPRFDEFWDFSLEILEFSSFLIEHPVKYFACLEIIFLRGNVDSSLRVLV